MAEDVLLERGAQRGALLARLADARDGRGSVVLVTGEAGSGKSRLLRDVAAGTTTLWGRCEPHLTPRPLGPALDLAVALEWSTDLEPWALFARLHAELSSRPDPVLVIIEDAHWADALTCAMIQYLGRRIEETRAVLAISYRADEVGPDLRAALGDLARQPEALERLEVGPLSVAAVAELARRTDLDPGSVHDLTGGNAFFVTEVVRAGGELPANVLDVVAGRNAALAPVGRSLVDIASTEPAGLESSAARPEARAAAGGVLEEHRGRLFFRHELARRATYASLPVEARRELHRARLEHLLLADCNEHARLAHHAVGSGDPQLIEQHVSRAAREAFARTAWNEAAAFFDTVLGLGNELAPDVRVRLLLERSDALARGGRQTEALTDAREALPLAERIGDPLQLGFALSTLARCLWRAGDPGKAATTINQAIDLLEPLGRTREFGDALRVRGHHWMLARRREPALADVRRAVAIAEALGETRAALLARMVEGTVRLVTGSPDEGVALLEAVREDAERSGEHRVVPDVLGMLGSGGGEARRYEEAFAWNGQLIADAEDRDNDLGVEYSTAWQARIRFEQGRWDEAAELLQITAAGPQAPYTTATVCGVLARLRVRRGDPRPEELLDTIDSMGALELQHRWQALCARAEAHWLSGEPQQGRAAVDVAYREALETDSPWARGELGFWLWRNGGIERAPEGAAEPFAAHMDGDWRTAADLWHTIGCPYEEALALLDGDTEAAVAGLQIMDRLGARPAANRARRDLAALGIISTRAPRRQTRSHPFGLTERESEIHDLVLAGLGNLEIARRLYLSRRTVEHHVSSILRKRGVSARTDLLDTAGAKDP